MRGERIDITCQHCGKVFSWLKSQGLRKHCSMACKSAAAERIEADCLNCGKHIVLLKSQRMSKGHGRNLTYCSKACQIEYNRRPPSTCEHCDREFKGHNPRQRFCSMACRGATFTPPKYKDGRSTHPQYGRWFDMVARCTKPNHPQYPSYGGRGITVCDEWLDPLAFYQYIDDVLGLCPPGRSMDRIDNDKGYEPGNVRWATAAEQSRNRRVFTVDPTGNIQFDGPLDFVSALKRRDAMRDALVRAERELAEALERAQAAGT